MHNKATTSSQKNRLTIYILIAMAAGTLAGFFVHENSAEAFRNSFSSNVNLLTTIFLRLVQMIIAPLVFSTLVVGIAKLGDLKTVGRVGGKALLWFVSASLVSLFIGLILVNSFKPGTAIHLTNTDIPATNELANNTQQFSLSNFIDHVFPKSIFLMMKSTPS